MRAAVVVLLLLAGAVNLLPLLGVLGPERLRALYGVPFEEPNLEILMRHRAVLFGIVGGLLVAAAFQPALRPAAVIAGLVSMLSFVAIAWAVGDANAELRRVVAVDLVASALLILAAVLDHVSG